MNEREVKQVLRQLRQIIVIIFISMAIMSTAAVFSFRAASEASMTTKETQKISKANRALGETNSRTLELVEDCLINGNCGPDDGAASQETRKLVAYIVDAVSCILLIAPQDRNQANVENCQKQAVSE